MDPLTVDGNALFVFVPSANAHDDTGLPVCKICTPPKTLGETSMSEAHITKFIRNHAAAHMMSTPFVGKVCGLCCGPNCKLEIKITQQNRISIKNGSGIIPLAAIIQHNCQTFSDLGTFPFKYCNKPIKGFPCTNMPVLCLDCPDSEVPRFIWSWDIEVHYLQHHSGMTEDEKSKYATVVVTDKEMEDIKRLFPVNIPQDN
jgi:hypothetical protein